MIYGNMISEYMVPDTMTNDPMEARDLMEVDLPW